MKPDLVGPDRVSTAISSGAAGTSFSAPHVTGAAALGKQAYPLATPAQISSFLQSRAVDLGAVGKDNQFGSGRLNLGVPAVDLTADAGAGADKVSWSGIAIPSPRDWIGLFRVGEGNNQYLDWKYVNCVQSSSGERPAGNCDFTLPSTPGSYDFRLFAGGGQVALGTSATLDVAAPASITATPGSVAGGGTVNVS